MNTFIIQYDLEVFLRILIISVLAGVLGWERESSGKAAGVRTHILVGIACVLFVVVGQFMSQSFATLGPHVRFDIANLLGAIVTGVSFLGAGMIFFKRGSTGEVAGLTTAAGILTTAAIAVLVGLQKYVLAVGCTLIVFFVLRFVNLLEIKVRLKAKENSASLEPTEDGQSTAI